MEDYLPKEITVFSSLYFLIILPLAVLLIGAFGGLVLRLSMRLLELPSIYYSDALRFSVLALLAVVMVDYWIAFLVDVKVYVANTKIDAGFEKEQIGKLYQVGQMSYQNFVQVISGALCWAMVGTLFGRISTDNDNYVRLGFPNGLALATVYFSIMAFLGFVVISLFSAWVAYDPAWKTWLGI